MALSTILYKWVMQISCWCERHACEHVHPPYPPPFTISTNHHLGSFADPAAPHLPALSCTFCWTLSCPVLACPALRCAVLDPIAMQFWVWSLYDAMRSGKAGIKPLAGSRLASESTSRNGKYVCIPNKIKF